MARLTRLQVKRRIAFAIAFTFLLIWSAYCGYQRYRDHLWLAETAHRIVREKNAQTPKDQAIAIRDFLRVHVTYKGAAHDIRPFLRDTARETIECGLGYCGESSRAFVMLASEVGLRAQRVNLHGSMNHVVVEAEIRPGRFVLFDPQNNPELNSYFDDQELSAEELILKPGSPFTRYSNLNLRRVPIVSSIVLHVKTEEGWVTRTLESPWMLKCLIGLGLSGLMLTVAVVDRLLVRIYAQRLGVSFSSEGCRLQSEETTKPSGGMIESCVI